MKLLTKINQTQIRSLVAFLFLVLFLGGLSVINKEPGDISSSNSPQSDTDSNNSDNPNQDDASDPHDLESESKGLPKPTLNKSSGNNGPIPSGVLVNFTCGGTSNAICQIILTNIEDNEIITLEKKSLESGERGQPTAVWTWKSVKGKWQVVAQVSAEGFENNKSELQELVVE